MSAQELSIAFSNFGGKLVAEISATFRSLHQPATMNASSFAFDSSVSHQHQSISKPTRSVSTHAESYSTTFSDLGISVNPSEVLLGFVPRIFVGMFTKV
jgi:hypothetical protein